jgi:hypothetical protein
MDHISTHPIGNFFTVGIEIHMEFLRTNGCLKEEKKNRNGTARLLHVSFGLPIGLLTHGQQAEFGNCIEAY